MLAPNVDAGMYVTQVKGKFLVQLDPGMEWFSSIYPQSLYQTKEQMVGLVTDALAYYTDKKSFPVPSSLRIVHVHQLSK